MHDGKSGSSNLIGSHLLQGMSAINEDAQSFESYSSRTSSGSVEHSKLQRKRSSERPGLRNRHDSSESDIVVLKPPVTVGESDITLLSNPSQSSITVLESPSQVEYFFLSFLYIVKVKQFLEGFNSFTI